MTGFIIMSFILVSGLIAVFSSTMFSESAKIKRSAHNYLLETERYFGLGSPISLAESYFDRAVDYI